MSNSTSNPTSNPTPAPFTSSTPADQLDDLRRRLHATRWPAAPEEAGWSLGTDLDYLRELVAYWADDFDWPAQEATLNRLPRFRAQVAGLRIHFIHARAVNPSGPVIPLVLSHGWPDSFWRYLKVIPLLTDPAAHGGDPADAFDVVVPDLPGFGYSEIPDPALNSVEVAGLWAHLMDDLGYRRFGAAGGDLGSQVSRYLALDHPDRVVAVHRVDGGLPAYDGDLGELSPAERDWFSAIASWSATEGAYAAMHSTKPQTAAYGLTDSAAGLAAWITEKLRTWSDCGGDLESSFSKDEILTLLSIYWFTGTIGSSMRMYHANATIPIAQRTRRVEVPSGFSIFAGDISRAPRAWLDRTANTVYATEIPRGGHFGAFEEPELYAEELRTFFRPYRQ